MCVLLNSFCSTGGADSRVDGGDSGYRRRRAAVTTQRPTIGESKDCRVRISPETGSRWGDLSTESARTKSLTIIVQNAGSRRPFDAWNRAQILVNSTDIVLTHIVKCWPGHDL